MAKKQALMETVVASSMTGYGHGQTSGKTVAIEVEIKSVNSRFLDVALRLPREYGAFEIGLRELVSAKLSRGRVEITVSRKPLEGQELQLRFNRGLFDAYLKLYGSLLAEGGAIDGAGRAALIRELMVSREVVEVAPMSAAQEEEWDLLKIATGSALDALCEMRKREGRKLSDDILLRIAELSKLRTSLQERSVLSSAQFKEKVLARVRKLAPEVVIDEARICTEVALLADRLDVTEELVRLKAHLGALEEALPLQSSGRRLDFLLQECGREFNTVAAKIQDAALQGLVVEAKSVLEKMREQVQNIE